MKLAAWISDRWRLGYRFRIAVVVASVLFLGLLIYPFKTTTVPIWSVRVIDEAGAPVREINVTEHWQDYPLELNGQEEARRTNQDGVATFDSRSVRASLARRLFLRITKPRNRTAVPYGAIVVWGSKNYSTTVAVYRGEELPQPEIRVQRSR
jgi:hypothetical protein